MALTDDQRAMLRLLAQSEVGYEDIAALKGIGVEEVEAQVRAALAEAAKEPAPAPQPEPPVEKPNLPVEPPTEKPKPTPEPAPAKPTAPRPRRPVPAERRRFLAFAGGAVGIVALVLIAIAVFGGDSGPTGEASPSAVEASGVEGTADGQLTQAVLEPADGGDATGRAIFGRLGKEEIVLQVTAEGLEPTAGGESYTAWLYRTPKLAVRVGSAKVGDSGRLGARFPIPAELLAYVASGAFTQVYLSRTSDAAYRAEVARAKRQKGLPRYTGETVLRGEITGPIARPATGQGG